MLLNVDKCVIFFGFVVSPWIGTILQHLNLNFKVVSRKLMPLRLLYAFQRHALIASSGLFLHVEKL